MSSESISKARVQGDLNLSRLLSSSILSGIVVLNGRQQIVTLTDTAARMLSLSPSLSLPAPFEVLPELVGQLVRDAFSSGMPITGIPINPGSTAPGVLPVSASVFLVNPGKDSTQVVVVLTALSLAASREQRLQRFERLASVGTLSAGLAHEIKNALVPVKTFADLLLEKESGHELAGLVRRELARIESLVSGMLRFGGPVRPAFGAVSLHEVLDRALRLVQPQLEGKSISSQRSLQAVPDLVEGDEQQLEQAFLNLYLNAFEATGPGGTLVVSTEVVTSDAGLLGRTAEPIQLRITIKDTGSGVSPTLLEHLFEPFVTTKPDGTGLGLAITKGIIEQHQGTIAVKSAPGEGTTFQITLPAMAGKGAPGRSKC